MVMVETPITVPLIISGGENACSYVEINIGELENELYWTVITWEKIWFGFTIQYQGCHILCLLALLAYHLSPLIHPCMGQHHIIYLCSA